MWPSPEKARCLRVLPGKRYAGVPRRQKHRILLDAEQLLEGELEPDEAEKEALVTIQKVSNMKQQSWNAECTQKRGSNPGEQDFELNSGWGSYAGKNSIKTLHRVGSCCTIQVWTVTDLITWVLQCRHRRALRSFASGVEGWQVSWVVWHERVIIK